MLWSTGDEFGNNKCFMEIFLFFRRALRRGESVKYLVQDVVIDYIKDHRLYGMIDK